MARNLGFSFGRTPEGRDRELAELENRLAQEALAQQQNQEPQNIGLPTKTPKLQPNLKRYIYVPSMDLFFTSSRILKGKNWEQTQDILKSRGLFMPTPYQFKYFLKFLRDSKNTKHKSLFRDITDKKEPYKSNHLNATFEKRGKDVYMISENILVNGKYTNIEQKLNEFSNNYASYISLDDWLNSDAPHGLPKEDISSNPAPYWDPKEKIVSRFYSLSTSLGICYRRDLLVGLKSLGVFACAENPETLNARNKK